VLFYLVITLCFILSMLVESSVLSFFMLDRAIPDLFLVLVVSLGFLLGEKRGAVTGLLAGLFQDAMLGPGLGYFALAKMAIGYGVGLLSREFYQDQLLAPTLIVFVGTLTHEFILYFLISQFIGLGVPVEWSLSRFFIPKALYNMGLILLIYPAVFNFYYRNRFTNLKAALRERRF